VSSFSTSASLASEELSSTSTPSAFAFDGWVLTKLLFFVREGFEDIRTASAAAFSKPLGFV